jgi:glycosyltransferase involved in cell wall biosynthesis
MDTSQEPANEAAPTVSCLMVTADRRRLCRRAICCYKRQTYPDRELVVVDDGEQDLLPVLSAVPDEELTYVQLESDKNYTLGRLRNVALESANGQFMAQWDDDDWYHPERIETQAQVLRDGYEACCLQGTLMHIDSPKYVDHPYIGYLEDGVPGTIMHRSDPEIRYPEIRQAEDSAYLQKWKDKKYKIIKNKTHLFIRCFHGDNTWKKGHFLTRIRNTIPDALSYIWHKYFMKDMFEHSRFKISKKDKESFEKYIEDSSKLGLLTFHCGA